MSSRIVLPALGLVVLVGALAAGAVYLLRADPAPTEAHDPSSDGAGIDGAEGEGGVPSPTVSDVDPRVHRQLQHDLPWPFAEFNQDISDLRRPRRREIFMKRQQIEDELGRKLSEPRVTLHLENATPETIIEELRREFAAHGLEVYTRDPPVDNDPVFERFYMSDVSIWDVIGSMRVRTNDMVTYAITPVGLCIGSEKACIDARADATLWEQEQVGEGDPDEEFEFLSGDYRPDFTGAHIGAVIRDIREQTGVEVVVGPELWNAPVQLTWSSDPMPVLAALRQIAIKCGGALFAKDGRVFLLDR